MLQSNIKPEKHKDHKMAKTKLTFKTPLAELRYVNIVGQGKLRFDPTNKFDKNKAEAYEYTASVILSKEQADVITANFKDFWNENKPKGLTKQKYDLVKAEMKDTGKKDEDGDAIKEPTGFYILQAKTTTEWPSGDKNIVKIMRGNGNPLNLGVKQIGDGSVGVIHGQIGVNDFAGNEGLNFFLSGVQLKSFKEKTDAEIDAEDLGGDEGMDELDMDTADISNEAPTNTPEV